MDTLVESLVTASLSEVLQTIEDPDRLKDQVESWKAKNLKSPAPSAQLSVSVSPPSKSPAPSATPSQDSLLANPDATASAPEHPSTPISVDAALSTPPRTSSPSGSIPSAASERDRVYQAICKLERHNQSQLADLVMSLPKRERAMCLFNNEVLRAKLVDAKLVLELSGEEEVAVPEVPVTPQTKKVVRSTALEETTASPRTPDLSSRGASAAASPMPTTPSTSIASNMSASTATVSSTWTVAGLAKLSAVEIIKVLSDPKVNFPDGVVKADPIVKQTTDEFVDSLMNKPVQQQKQMLGDKLYVPSPVFLFL
jgi:polyadenylate-binding protein